MAKPKKSKDHIPEWVGGLLDRLSTSRNPRKTVSASKTFPRVVTGPKTEEVGHPEPDNREPLPVWAEVLWSLLHGNLRRQSVSAGKKGKPSGPRWDRVRSLASDTLSSGSDILAQAFPFLFLILAVIIGFVSQWLLRTNHVLPGLVCLAAAAACAWTATREDRLFEEFPSTPPSSAPAWVLWTVLAVAVLLPLMNLRTFTASRNLVPATLVWLGTPVAVWVLLVVTARRPNIAVAPRRMDLLERWGLPLVLFVSAVFMFFRLMSVPANLWPESIGYTLSMFNVLDGQVGAWKIGDGTGTLPLLFESIKTILWSLTRDLFFTMRGTSAVFGFLSVAICYFVIRRWAPSAAIVSALLLGSSFILSVLSRWGFSHSFAIFLTLTFLYFFSRAVQERRRSDALLAGVSLGFGVFTTVAGSYLILYVLILFAYLLLRPKLLARRETIILLLIVVAGFWSAASPMIQESVKKFGWKPNPQLVQPMPGSPQMTWSNMGSRVKTSLRLFTVEGNPGVVEYSYIQKSPLLDGVTSVFALLGLVLVAVRWSQFPAFALIVLAVVFFFPLVLLDYTVYPRNFAQATPVLFICAGLALSAGLKRVTFFLGPRVGWAAIGAVIVWIVGLNAFHLFGQLPRWEAQYHMQQGGGVVSSMAQEMYRDVKRGETVYALNDLEAGVVIDNRFMRLPRRYLPYKSWEDIVAGLPSDGSGSSRMHFYFMQSHFDNLWPLIKHFYPGAMLVQHLTPGSNKDYFHVIIPAEESAALHALDFTPGGSTVAEGKGFAVRLTGTAGLSLKWNGYIIAPVWGEYLFRGTGQETIFLTLNDRKVLPGKPVLLAQGLHRLNVEWIRPKQAMRLQWRVPESLDFSEIPRGVLLTRGVPEGQGLTGVYVPEGKGKLPPSFTRIDPDLYFSRIQMDDSKLFGPDVKKCRITWRGSLEFPVPGSYTFVLSMGGGDCEVLLDRQRLFRLSTPMQDISQIQSFTPRKAGKLPIEVRYTGRFSPKSLRLQWSTPLDPIRATVPSVLLHTIRMSDQMTVLNHKENKNR